MDRKELGRRIAEKRNSLGESQAIFGSRFGVTQQAVFNWEKGVSIPAQDILLKLCILIKVDFQEVAHLKARRTSAPLDITPGPDTHGMVPLISWVKAGAWTETDDTFQPGDSDQFIYATRQCGPNAFALTIHGDSMEPEFLEGDIIIVDPAAHYRNGSYVVVKNGAGEATFKQLVFDGDSVFLKPLNNRYPIKDMTGIEFRIVGVVVQKVKNYL